MLQDRPAYWIVGQYPASFTCIFNIRPICWLDPLSVDTTPIAWWIPQDILFQLDILAYPVMDVQYIPRRRLSSLIFQTRNTQLT